MPEPHARSENVVVTELPEELLVYDLDSHRAHCLNRAAAVVWRHCDGRRSVAEISRILQDETAAPGDEAVVWHALDRLSGAGLLREPLTRPEGVERLSRRELGRRLGLVGALSAALPVVTSIVAPTAAEAASQPCIDAINCGPGNETKRCCSGGTCVKVNGLGHLCQ